MDKIYQNEEKPELNDFVNLMTEYLSLNYKNYIDISINP